MVSNTIFAVKCNFNLNENQSRIVTTSINKHIMHILQPWMI